MFFASGVVEVVDVSQSLAVHFYSPGRFKVNFTYVVLL